MDRQALGPRLCRRDFLKASTGAAGMLALSPLAARSQSGTGAAKPNVLWISVEDISPDLGCYGDAYAVTPAIDGLAQEGIRYEHAYAHMGVCAPARSGIITGMYPTCMGTNHMRCKGVPPPEVRCFTEYLRANGYVCTNRSKTDYQFDAPPTAWDLNGGDAHWRKRPEGVPFFSVINLGTTHEGQIRNPRRRAQCDEQLAAAERHDPARAVLPPYYPDTPVVRADWAQYYDLVTLMDKEVARILQDLEDDGLADDTIVWFWGDHGRGLPRAKRWIYDSGLRFPLIVRIPPKYRRLAAGGKPLPGPGGVVTDLVGFVDFAPTMLSLTNVPIPGHIQGQAFLGPQRAESRTYVYGARDRVDEAMDMIRTVRDHRFKYIRNFMPHLPRSLNIDYMNKMPTMQEMRRLHAADQLKPGAQMQYFEPAKPVEELYDTLADPHEVRNLADRPEHQETLARLRDALFAWMAETGDFGLLPEPEFDALKRPGDTYEVTAAPGFEVAPAGPERVAVNILCTTPGASIACAVDRRAPDEIPAGVFLNYRDAKVHGNGLQKTPDRGIIGWRDINTWISWTVTIPRAGTIPVHVLQACNGRAGSPYRLSVGDQVLEAVVQDTHAWYNHRYVNIGEITIPAAGEYTVALKPQPQDRTYSMNLMAVVLDGQNLETAEPTPEWQLYTGPVILDKGQRIRTRACRLGFRNSPVVEYRAGDTPPQPEPCTTLPHWRQRIPDGGLQRLLNLKRLDGQGARAIQAYRRILKTPDPSASMRYWAVLGLHTNAYGSATPLDLEVLTPLLQTCLEDDAAVVRITAAMALCSRGLTAKAMPVLLHELKHGDLASGRLFAATALWDIGEHARPAIPDLLEARKQGGYVNRMCTHVLRALGEQV